MLDVEEYRKKSYYELLGVSRDATVAQIKEAYREIAKMYHPDSNYYGELVEYELNERDQKLFQLVTAAYDTLIRDDRRAEYDKKHPAQGGSWDEPPPEPTVKNAGSWSEMSRAGKEDLLRSQKLKARQQATTFDSVGGRRDQQQQEGPRSSYQPYCHFGREARFVQEVETEVDFDLRKRLVHVAAIGIGFGAGILIFLFL